MVLFMFLYLLWGMKTGTCHVFVYLFFLRNPLRVLGHIIHSWKGIHEEIAAPLEPWETVQYWWRNSENKFDEYDLGGEVILEVCLGLLVAWIATYGYLRHFHGLCKKGDGSFIWKSMQRIQESWVNIRLPLISLISFLSHNGFWSNLVSTESYFQGVSNTT